MSSSEASSSEDEFGDAVDVESAQQQGRGSAHATGALPSAAAGPSHLPSAAPPQQRPSISLALLRARVEAYEALLAQWEALCCHAQKQSPQPPLPSLSQQQQQQQQQQSTAVQAAPLAVAGLVGVESSLQALLSLARGAAATRRAVAGARCAAAAAADDNGTTAPFALAATLAAMETEPLQSTAPDLAELGERLGALCTRLGERIDASRTLLRGRRAAQARRRAERRARATALSAITAGRQRSPDIAIEYCGLARCGSVLCCVGITRTSLVVFEARGACRVRAALHLSHINGVTLPYRVSRDHEGAVPPPGQGRAVVPRGAALTHAPTLVLHMEPWSASAMEAAAMEGGDGSGGGGGGQQATSLWLQLHCQTGAERVALVDALCFWCKHYNGRPLPCESVPQWSCAPWAGGKSLARDLAAAVLEEGEAGALPPLLLFVSGPLDELCAHVLLCAAHHQFGLALNWLEEGVAQPAEDALQLALQLTRVCGSAAAASAAEAAGTARSAAAEAQLAPSRAATAAVAEAEAAAAKHSGWCRLASLFEALGLHHLGCVLLASGRAQAARQVLVRSSELVQTFGNAALEVGALLQLAAAAAALGHEDAAQAFVAEAACLQPEGSMGSRKEHLSDMLARLTEQYERREQLVEASSGDNAACLAAVAAIMIAQSTAGCGDPRRKRFRPPPPPPSTTSATVVATTNGDEPAEDGSFVVTVVVDDDHHRVGCDRRCTNGWLLSEVLRRIQELEGDEVPEVHALRRAADGAELPMHAHVHECFGAGELAVVEAVTPLGRVAVERVKAAALKSAAAVMAMGEGAGAAGAAAAIAAASATDAIAAAATSGVPMPLGCSAVLYRSQPAVAAAVDAAVVQTEVRCAKRFRAAMQQQMVSLRGELAQAQARAAAERDAAAAATALAGERGAALAALRSAHTAQSTRSAAASAAAAEKRATVEQRARADVEAGMVALRTQHHHTVTALQEHLDGNESMLNEARAAAAAADARAAVHATALGDAQAAYAKVVAEQGLHRARAARHGEELREAAAAAAAVACEEAEAKHAAEHEEMAALAAREHAAVLAAAEEAAEKRHRSAMEAATAAAVAANHAAQRMIASSAAKANLGKVNAEAETEAARAGAEAAANTRLTEQKKLCAVANAKAATEEAAKARAENEIASLREQLAAATAALSEGTQNWGQQQLELEHQCQQQQQQLAEQHAAVLAAEQNSAATEIASARAEVVAAKAALTDEVAAATQEIERLNFTIEDLRATAAAAVQQEQQQNGAQQQMASSGSAEGGAEDALERHTALEEQVIRVAEQAAAHEAALKGKLQQLELQFAEKEEELRMERLMAPGAAVIDDGDDAAFAAAADDFFNQPSSPATAPRATSSGEAPAATTAQLADLAAHQLELETDLEAAVSEAAAAVAALREERAAADEAALGHARAIARLGEEVAAKEESAEAERAKAEAEAAQALDTALREAAARHEAAMRELLDAKEVEQRAAAAAAERRARSSHTEWMEGTMKERRAAQHAALTAALKAKVRLQLLDRLRCCPIFCLAVLSIAALASPRIH
jgi:hypothetical protein